MFCSPAASTISSKRLFRSPTSERTRESRTVPAIRPPPSAPRPPPRVPADRDPRLARWGRCAETTDALSGWRIGVAKTWFVLTS